MGTMTPLLRRLHKLAKKHNLPNALGRAIVMVNRHYNDGWSSTGVSFNFPGKHRDEVDFMRRIRPETATRWLRHWSNGGSLRVFGVSREEYSARRRKEEAERRERLRESAIYLEELAIEDGQARWSETGSTRKN